MGRVIIATADEASPGAFPTLTGVTVGGGIQSRGVVAKEDRPLHLWVHQLQPNAEIRWRQAPVGHLVYVWEGGVTANGESVGADSVLAVEHKGEASLRAGASGAKLVHYYQREGATPPVKSGGHAHVVGKNGVFRGSKVPRSGRLMHTKMWVNSSCPTCGLWLHKVSYTDPFPQSTLHYHTEDEIIFILEGGIALGRKTHLPGTALAIDVNTVYGFGVPEGGMTFINFRPSEPGIVLMSKDGPASEVFNEREMLLAWQPEPAEAN